MIPTVTIKFNELVSDLPLSPTVEEEKNAIISALEEIIESGKGSTTFWDLEDGNQILLIHPADWDEIYG
jgi:hypothetical protein